MAATASPKRSDTSRGITRLFHPSWAISILFGLTGLLLAVTSMRIKSVTYDETSHLAAGYTYWRTGDFRLTPDHPPLAELLAAAPLLVMDLKIPEFAGPHWELGNVWGCGRNLLNKPNDVDAMLYWARLPIVGLWCLGGFMACVWSRRLFGPWGGVVTAGLYFLSPNLLAHARVVTTDVAAGVFFLASLWAGCSLLEEVNPTRLLAAAAALAGLFLSKFSAVLILPVLGVLLLVRSSVREPLPVRLLRKQAIQSRAGKLGTLCVVGLFLAGTTLLAIWAAFDFRYAVSPDVPAGTTRHLPKPARVFDPADRLTDQQRQWLVEWYGRKDVPVWNQLLHRSPVMRSVLTFARDHRLLPEAYLYGLAFTVRSTQARQSYLWGRTSETGWWYYFPVALAIKTPLAVWGVIMLAFWSLVRRQRGVGTNDGLHRWCLLGLLVFVTVYLLKAIAGNINIGVRHLIPVQMAMFVLCGSTGAWMTQGPRTGRLLVPGLLACLGGATLWAWPDYLPFFNSLVGGARNGWKYLDDSNVDWGQDLPRLAEYLRTQQVGEVKIAYFGTGRPEYYGIQATYFATPFEACSLDGGPPGPYATLWAGTYVMSATALQGWNVPMRLYDWDDALADEAEELTLRVRKLLAAGREEDDPEVAPLLRRLGTMRYAQLLAALRQREPDDIIGKSLLIYHLTQADLDRIHRYPETNRAASGGKGD